MASWAEPAVGILFSSRSNLPVSANFSELKFWKVKKIVCCCMRRHSSVWWVVISVCFLFVFFHIMLTCSHCALYVHLNPRVKLIANWKWFLCDLLQGCFKQIAAFSILITFGHAGHTKLNRDCLFSKVYSSLQGKSVFEGVTGAVSS